jgi:hypothetical protein
MKKLNTLFSLLSIFLLLSCASHVGSVQGGTDYRTHGSGDYLAPADAQSTADANRDRLVEKLIARKDFMGLFENSEKIGSRSKPGAPIYITKAVEAYLDICCRQRDALVQMLREQGFKVLEGIPYNKSRAPFDQKQLVYDEIVSINLSKPGPMIFRTIYRARFYISKGQVVLVWAYTATD